MDIWRGSILFISSFIGVGLGIGFFLLLPIKAQQYFTLPLRGRDFHRGYIPRIGGLIIIPITIGTLWIAVLTRSIQSDISWAGITIGAIGVLLYGIWDERKDLSWQIQFILQIIIGAVLVGSGISLSGIMIPFVGIVELQTIIWDVMGIIIYPFSAMITILWVVGLMNVVNWLDGLDGLASGVGIIALSTLTILALTPFVNQYHIAIIGMILIGGYGGFLWFNWSPAKVFLGTTGSMFLGYMLAVLSLMSGGKIGTSVLVLAFPILDAGIVIIRRIFSGDSIFEADKKHLHYELCTLGWSQRQVVYFLYSISIVFGICSLLFGTTGKFVTLVIGAVVLIFLTMWIKIRKKTSFLHLFKL